MLAKFTKHALVRRVDAASTGARASSIGRACNDNARAGAGATAGRTRTRRPVLACHWRVVPATGALECFWQDESADGATAPSPWRSRTRHAHRAIWECLHKLYCVPESRFAIIVGSIYGWAMCQAPLRKPSPVMSPGFLSFFQL
jgi:hypothetical protein